MRNKLFFVSLLFTILFSVSAHADDINISVNGNTIELDDPAVIVEDRTLVPLRAVSNALNCAVSWDANTRGIIVCGTEPDTENENLVLCWINKEYAYNIKANALYAAYKMDSPPIIINDRTYVPIRAISELLGTTVNWDSDSKTVMISAMLSEKIPSDEHANQITSFETAVYNKYDVYSSIADGNPKTINAEIELENGSKIGLCLYPGIAPETVGNFVKLCEDKFYDGLIFHRVIAGLMIQGGGIDKVGNRKTSNTIHGEFLANGFINLMPHNRGVISMARTNVSMDSASNQFFIMHSDYPNLNGNYAAFGYVTYGMEYVDAIAQTETDGNDKPLQNQIIKSINILK